MNFAQTHIKKKRGPFYVRFAEWLQMFWLDSCRKEWKQYKSWSLLLLSRIHWALLLWVTYGMYAVVLIQCSSVFLFLLRSCWCFIDLFCISGDVSQQYVLSKGERKSWSEWSFLFNGNWFMETFYIGIHVHNHMQRVLSWFLASPSSLSMECIRIVLGHLLYGTYTSFWQGMP